MNANALHGGAALLLAGMFFVLPDYHGATIARILVLAVYAMGYNLLYGYTGLLSLGHAMFFAAGMYGFGLSVRFGGFGSGEAMIAGVLAAAATAVIVGYLALRTMGIAFMIVTLMFSQAVFLAILLFGKYTRGDEGFVIQQSQRLLFGLDVTDPLNRYFIALAIFVACLAAIGYLVRTTFGRCLVAIRENEDRARMLGYDVLRHKFLAVIASGTISGLAGATYAMLFGYAGATFASVQYSILPLLWVLLGGAGTTIGPLVGTAFAFYLVDIASGFTTAYMLVVGMAIILLTLFAPQGIAGEIRRRIAPWMP